MTMSVKAVPAGYHTVTPYLIVDGAAAALEFYKRAFGAEEVLRLSMPSPTGEKIAHAELQFGDSRVMLADEFPAIGAKGPRAFGGSPVGLCLYVSDVDALFARATGAGCTVERPLTNQFYGDRSATLVDPYGHKWTIATHLEDVYPEEMGRRMAAMQP
jgi:PhnB protein